MKTGNIIIVFSILQSSALPRGAFPVSRSFALPRESFLCLAEFRPASRTPYLPRGALSCPAELYLASRSPVLPHEALGALCSALPRGARSYLAKLSLPRGNFFAPRNFTLSCLAELCPASRNASPALQSYNLPRKASRYLAK